MPCSGRRFWVRKGGRSNQPLTVRCSSTLSGVECLQLEGVTRLHSEARFDLAPSSGAPVWLYVSYPLHNFKKAPDAIDVYVAPIKGGGVGVLAHRGELLEALDRPVFKRQRVTMGPDGYDPCLDPSPLAGPEQRRMLDKLCELSAPPPQPQLDVCYYAAAKATLPSAPTAATSALAQLKGQLGKRQMVIHAMVDPKVPVGTPRVLETALEVARKAQAACATPADPGGQCAPLKQEVLRERRSLVARNWQPNWYEHVQAVAKRCAAKKQ